VIPSTFPKKPRLRSVLIAQLVGTFWEVPRTGLTLARELPGVRE
jgi:hypothetical protein